VVELKRGQSNDETVGQVLRYIGWVKRHLAGPDESVEGLIISRAFDASLSYALVAVGNVKAMVYRVRFSLEGVDGV